MSDENRDVVPGGGFAETLKVVLPLAAMQLVYAANSIWERFLLSQRGCAALQASLSASMVSVMFVCLLSAAIGYTSVYVAQFHGAGRGRDAVRAFAQGVWLSVFSIPLLVLLAFAAFALVDVAAHAPEVAAGEKAYIAIYVPGGFFTILSGVFAGLLTGQGRTGWVSVCGVVGVLVNIALSPIFIDGWGPVPAMGNAGAAIAGVISLASVAALQGAAVCRDALVRAHGRDGALRPDFPLMWKILRTGAFNGMTAFASCVAFTVFTLVLGRFDALGAGSANVVFAVNNLFYCVMCALSDGVCIVSGRRHGANDTEAVRRTVRTGVFLCLGLLAAVYCVLLPLSGVVADVFLPNDAEFTAEAWRASVRMLFIIMLVREVGEGLGMVFEGALRGVGDVRFVMGAKLGCDICLWMPAVLAVAAFHRSLLALWLTMPAFFAVLSTVLFLRFRSGAWIRRRLSA